MEMKHIKTQEQLNEATENSNISGISDRDFIFNLLEHMLNKQEENVVNYMNEFMTQEERNRHGDNICNYLLSASGTLAEIRLRMMADGREIK